MNTAASQVGTIAKRVDTGPREEGAPSVSVAIVAAYLAALLFVLGGAWFATGAGMDYPEPLPAVTGE
jgi:hypothetical protein